MVAFAPNIQPLPDLAPRLRAQDRYWFSRANTPYPLGLVASGLLLWLCVCGCGKKSVPPAPPIAAPTDESLGQHSASSDPEEAAPDRTADVGAIDLDEPSPDRPSVPEFDTGGDWTTRRLIALTEYGPVTLDLSLAIGRKSLEAATQEKLSAIRDGLLAESETKEISWDDLLKLPLVASGWLGNLVPEAEQQAQLVSMYDRQGNDLVEAEELDTFLSRGLARTSPLQFTDRGSEPSSDRHASPWGPADRDNNRTLDGAELEQLTSSLLRLDYNGDAIITLAEVEQLSGGGDASMSRATLLQSTSVLVAEETRHMTNKEIEANSKRLITELMQHYTFLNSISREQWPGWPEAWWSQLDADGDTMLDKHELQLILQIPPQVQVYVRFPDLEDKENSIESHAVFERSSAEGLQWHWNGHSGGGHLSSELLSLTITFQDGLSGAQRTVLDRQLRQAIKQPAMRQFLQSQLELAESAWEVADEDGDQELSEDELQRIWQWLSLRQGTRTLGGWMLVARPWFHLADRNGDGRITELERERFSGELLGLDRNGDGILTPSELPLVVKLELARQDGRLSSFLAGRAGGEALESAGDWFSAMDTNRDGAISGQEFLGDEDDFQRLDTDADGFVTRSEVYSAVASY